MNGAAGASDSVLAREKMHNAGTIAAKDLDLFKMVDEREDASDVSVLTDDQDLVRERQASRARIMALLLGAFVILLFAITIAKMALTK